VLVGISAIPLLSQSGQDRSCWLRDAAAPAGQVVYVLCEQGALWTTRDAGATWSKGDTGATEKLRAMAFLDANRGFAVGDHGLMLVTEDGGKKWQPRKVDLSSNFMDIHFSGESGWVVGYQGVILHSKDGGRTWTKQETKTTQTLETVYFADANHGWVTGWAGTILRTTDGGQKWEAVRCDAASWSLTSVYFRDAKVGWMVGFAGQIFKSKDGGLTWQKLNSPVRSWLTNIAFDGSNRAWISYDDGLLVSQDDGETWKPVEVNGSFFLSKLVRVNQSLWAVGQSTVLRQADGLKWERIPTLTPNTTGGTSGTGTGSAAGTAPAGPER
jgi:photosystem II stability/assembly factor-like uncharacterized protein